MENSDLFLKKNRTFSSATTVVEHIFSDENERETVKRYKILSLKAKRMSIGKIKMRKAIKIIEDEKFSSRSFFKLETRFYEDYSIFYNPTGELKYQYKLCERL